VKEPSAPRRRPFTKQSIPIFWNQTCNFFFGFGLGRGAARRGRPTSFVVDSGGGGGAAVEKTAALAKALTCAQLETCGYFFKEIITTFLLPRSLISRTHE
jgi:hypothetical protein